MYSRPDVAIQCDPVSKTKQNLEYEMKEEKFCDVILTKSWPLASPVQKAGILSLHDSPQAWHKGDVLKLSEENKTKQP